MKDKAIAYLTKNHLLHMGMVEAIRRDSAEILYADIDGVLIKEEKSKAYMISVSNFDIGQNLVNHISKCNLIAVHQKYMVDYISTKFGLKEGLECFQAAYMNKVKLEVKDELEIRPLEEDQIEIVLEYYTKISPNEILLLLKNRSLCLVDIIMEHL